MADLMKEEQALSEYSEEEESSNLNGRSDG
jgi:hypothetical protein